MNKKAVIIAILVVIIMFLIPGKVNAQAKENIYPNAGIVIDLDKANDLVIFQDFSGQEWDFKGVEDYMIGDIIAVIMNDKGTESIYDDEIIDVRYIGYAN